jgi:hypothetical protein
VHYQSNKEPFGLTASFAGAPSKAHVPDNAIAAYNKFLKNRYQANLITVFFE